MNKETNKQVSGPGMVAHTLTPAVGGGRQRQVSLFKSEANSVYILNTRTAKGA